VHEHREAGECEHAGDDPCDAAAQQLRQLLGDLGLGELDLLAHER
jgi:hypothetical protein